MRVRRRVPHLLCLGSDYEARRCSQRLSDLKRWPQAPTCGRIKSTGRSDDLRTLPATLPSTSLESPLPHASTSL